MIYSRNLDLQFTEDYMEKINKIGMSGMQYQNNLDIRNALSKQAAKMEVNNLIENKLVLSSSRHENILGDKNSWQKWKRKYILV
jgi:hypothetical protein